MNTPYAWQTRAAPSSAAYFDEGLRQHMLRVYNYMGLGLGRDRASWRSSSPRRRRSTSRSSARRSNG